MSSDDRNSRDDRDDRDAAGFSKLIEGLLAGDPIPPALDADDRALLETATMIVASSKDVELSAERGAALVDEALERALVGKRPLPNELANQASTLTTTLPDSAPDELRDKRHHKRADAVPERIEREDTDVIRISRKRADRVLRALPWVVAGVAVAAALLLFISRPENIGNSAREHIAQTSTGTSESTRAIPVHQSSRPTDALVGQIRPSDSAAASHRLDIIYADRMAGYRELRLTGTGQKAKGPNKP